MSIKFNRPYLYPKQYDAIYDKSRFSLIEASTKAGKTYGCMVWLLEEALRVKPGQNVWWVAPTSPVADIAFNRYYNELDKSLFRFRKSNPKIVTCPNGGKIVIKSADKPDSLYGEDVYAVVADEASRMKDDAWTAIRSTLTATQGKARIIGNVKGKKNWFYKMCRVAQSGSPNMAYHKITAYDAAESGVISWDEIESAKMQLPEARFRELYLAEPADDGGNPFDIRAIDSCVAPKRDIKSTVVFGLDLAKSHDWTVLIGLDQYGYTTCFERFQLPWSETIRRVNLIVQGRHCVVDSTGVGDPVLESLQSLGSNYEGFKFSSKSKQSLMETLAVAIQSQDIHFPEGAIYDELIEFEYQYTSTGVRYSAPEGLHDDCVMSLALAQWGRKHKKPSPDIFFI